MWRERVGIEPTSRLTTASAILKTVRTTRSVRSHDLQPPYPIKGDKAYLAQSDIVLAAYKERGFRRLEPCSTNASSDFDR